MTKADLRNLRQELAQMRKEADNGLVDSRLWNLVRQQMADVMANPGDNALRSKAYDVLQAMRAVEKLPKEVKP